MPFAGGLVGASSITIQQNVVADPGNSSTANIAIGGTFTGTWKNTLGVNSMQFTLVTNQPCRVFVDQSTDAVNVDTSDVLEYNPLCPNACFGHTVQAVGAYWRLRVQNLGSGIATGVRLYSVLCPIADPLPRSLDECGNLKTGQRGSWNTFGDPERSSSQGLRDVAQPYRLCGATFGAAVDGNFWVASGSMGAGESHTIAPAGVAAMVCGTAISAYAQFTTARIARFFNLNSHRVWTRARLPAVVVAGTTRRWGAYTLGVAPAPANGFYFQVSAAGVLSVVSCLAGVPSAVASGSFNGTVSQYTVDTNQHTYEIIYSQGKTRFVVDNVLLHTMVPTTAPLTATLDLPVTAACLGTGSTATLELWAGCIYRLGMDRTTPRHSYDTSTAGKTLKVGPGRLHSATIDTGVNAATFALYDIPIGPLANQITGATLSANATPVTLIYDLDFYNGLWLVTTGASVQTTVVYE